MRHQHSSRKGSKSKPSSGKKKARYVTKRFDAPVSQATRPAAAPAPDRFIVTGDAIVGVLSDYSERVINARGLSFEEMVPRILPRMDQMRIEREVLSQPAHPMVRELAAQRAIKRELVTMGYLEF